MPTQVRDRHVCHDCGKRFTVVYPQFDVDEPFRTVTVRCPYCGTVNRISVGSAAASAADYRIERIVSA